MNKKNLFLKLNTFKKASFVFSFIGLFVFLPFQTRAQELRFNWMPGDYETLTLKNVTQGTLEQADAIGANAGDEIRFFVHYHCGWDSSAWPTEKAQDTKIRVSFPINRQNEINTLAQVWASNVPAATDAGRINASSSQELIFENTARWHHDAIEENISTTAGTGYREVNIGDIACDCVGCYNSQGFVEFKAQLSETSLSSPNLSIDKLVKNVTDNTIWLNSISANPSDRVEFRIQITSVGTSTAYNVIARDVFPSQMSYLGNLKINGISSSGNILSGFNLGSLAPGLSKTITFEGKIASENNFAQGTTTLVNSSRVRADGLGEVYDTANINVVKSEVSHVALSVDKQVKNLTKDHASWYTSWITAKPDDKIAFRIKVTSTGTATAEDVTLKDVLPGHVSYKGNLEINGVSSSKDILSGMNIGDLDPGESKTITFEAKIASKSIFAYGTTELVNTALAYNNETAVSDAVTVKVFRTAVAGAVTDVPTGVLTSAKISLFITILLVLGASYFLLLKSYVSQKMVGFRVDELISDTKEKTKDAFLSIYLSPEVRSEKKLSKLIAEIKKREVLE